MKRSIQKFATASLVALSVSACSTVASIDGPARVLAGPPVTDNNTPYSQCLAELAAVPGNNLPVIAIGEVADKTGKFDADESGFAVSQGISEMTMSAFFKTGKARLVERFDLRLAKQELQFRKSNLAGRAIKAGKVTPTDFMVSGALTELNYNIVSGGAGLWVNGAGAGIRTVVVNVALDLRVVEVETLNVLYISSLQKQIIGYEVEANVFRFFGSNLIEFDAGQIRNEPMQLGVRSVVEMSVYQILTEFLGLPVNSGCELVEQGASAPKTTDEEHAI
jgi:curli production assembly/transport component CsgG/holdfast attachment protein HfaB